MRSSLASRRFLAAAAQALPVVLLTTALVFATASVAFARGGGGGGYGGGGDSGGGGGDGGFIVEIVFWLLLRHPTVGVPIVVVVLILMVVAGKKGKGAYQGSVIRRGSVALDGNRRAEALATLSARDPAFDEAQFSARVTTAFTKVQEAWCNHTMTPMRPFVSDGIHERFSLQTKEQKELGYRDRMDDLKVLGVDLAQVVAEGPFDVVTVAVRASASDYRVTLADGKKIRGTDLPEEFVEYWSFLRRKGRTTKPGQAGLIEGMCPNCGAAIEMNQWSACAYCKAVLRSGEFDWVLAEITQAVEWRDAPPTAVPGVAALRAKDPDFDLQHLEDRASVMFWRWAMAQRAGAVAPIRKIASPKFAETFAERLGVTVDPDGTRRWMGERAVGSVETAGIVPEGDRDRALVEVRWQGTEFQAKAGDAPVRGEKGSISQTLFSLSRAATARSDANSSVSSAHCPFCGAPELGGESDACEHCGQVMNDGSRDWVLDEVASRFAPEGERALDALRAVAVPLPPPDADDEDAASRRAAERPPVPSACMGWLVRMMVSDGAIDAKEREVLEGVADKAGMRRAELDSMVAAASSAGSENGPKPRDAAEAAAWMEVMAEVALADGRIDPAEARLLTDLGAAHGISKADVAICLAKTRARLFREAKEALRRRGRAA